MQLSNYIKDLLYRYECVIVPGFGAFLVHSHPAYIGEDQLFYPPSKTLSFNRQLQTNDGLLANHMASCEGCSYETALQQIRYYTKSLSLTLESQRGLKLQGIGEFSLDSEASLNFLPASQNYDSHSFGLARFAVHPMDRSSQQDDASSKDAKVRVLRERRTAPYIKYAAIGLLAVALSSLGGFKIYKEGVEKHNYAERQKATEALERQIQEATFVLDEPLPVAEVAVPEGTGRFHIIAGAYRIEENALSKLQELRDKGFPAKRLGTNRFGLHHIAYSSHADRSNALRWLKEIKAQDNPDAWLLVKDLSR